MVDLGDVDEWGGGSDRVVCVVDVVCGVVCDDVEAYGSEVESSEAEGSSFEK